MAWNKIHITQAFTLSHVTTVLPEVKVRHADDDAYVSLYFNNPVISEARFFFSKKKVELKTQRLPIDVFDRSNTFQEFS